MQNLILLSKSELLTAIEEVVKKAVHQPTALINDETLAKTLAIPVSKVRSLKKQGKIPHIRIDKYVRYDLQAVLNALNHEHN